ncbi:mitochondrial disulfide relay subunit Erv1 form 2 [Andalucia godoyi]|uniref:Sulfhydryl oxidase n=1 Tax=Andalucia godoyi TaxID=505711 RepID=A0A8K0AHI6_ANDGO|nr:mitochondrial disulfide relay subunit Erv1 form 2 [Andalucia godoyi]|eukprot:ANDGO_07814.mRNA.1 mitochondrial disulfide relay subunit Erv1 form 2
MVVVSAPPLLTQRNVLSAVAGVCLFFLFLYHMTSSPTQRGPVRTYDGGVDIVRRKSPPTKQELGRAAWMLMHSIAGNFDDEPTVERRDAAQSFVRGLLELFPCSVCSDDFKERILTKYPIDVSSRRAFSLWTCKVHNEVNGKLNKPLVPCEHFDRFYLGIGEH